MKNKRLILIFSIFVFVVLVAVISSTVFSLQDAQLQFKNEFDQFVEVDLSQYPDFNLWQTIANFKGKSMLFLDRDEMTETLEKQYCWLNVVGIEALFPNSVRIVAAVRVPVFHFVSGGVTYTCDAEGFVMSSEQADAASTVLIENGIFENVAVGTYLQGENASAVKKIIEGLWRQTHVDGEFTYATIPLFVSSIRFEDSNAVLQTSIGAKIVIYKPLEDTHKKITAAYGLFLLRTDRQLDGVFVAGHSTDENGNYMPYIDN